jgi:hypothetical protein
MRRSDFLSIGGALLTLVPGPIAGIGGAAFAALAMAVRLFIERSLLCAEAEHVVMLYYRADAA